MKPTEVQRGESQDLSGSPQAEGRPPFAYAEGGVSAPVDRSALGVNLDRPSIELITEAQRLWSLRRQDLLTPDEHEIALFALEQRYGLDVTECQRCHRRHSWKYLPEFGQSWCHHCIEVGHVIDEGWSAYKDATDA
jgi:hypothetical protein